MKIEANIRERIERNLITNCALAPARRPQGSSTNFVGRRAQFGSFERVKRMDGKTEFSVRQRQNPHLKHSLAVPRGQCQLCDDETPQQLTRKPNLQQIHSYCVS